MNILIIAGVLFIIYELQKSGALAQLEQQAQQFVNSGTTAISSNQPQVVDTPPIGVPPSQGSSYSGSAPQPSTTPITGVSHISDASGSGGARQVFQPAPVTPSSKYVNGVLLTKPFYNITSSNQVFRSTDGYGFTSFNDFTAAGGASDFSNVQKIAPQGAVGSSSFPNPVPVNPPLALRPVQPQGRSSSVGTSSPVAIPVTATVITKPAPVSLLWVAGPYSGIAGAYKLALPSGWNATSADGAISRQTGGQYKVITTATGDVVAVPVSATPPPVVAPPRVNTPTGPIYSGPQNPASLIGNELFVGVWNSNPTAQRPGTNGNFIPDASIGA